VRSQAWIVRRVFNFAAVAGVPGVVAVKAVAGGTLPRAAELLLPLLSAGQMKRSSTLFAVPDLASTTDFAEADHALKFALVELTDEVSALF
jgi:hypothetical protein